ncbi:hypothetical protein [Desertivirga brevis]|uniref:hypothetical protein n=1 Tax=Desertivirga brevis TaxID=2810310 RepID=UPI001A97170E|nr:hypothetical protein [Pedobacter sp. SYSU D00873]
MKQVLFSLLIITIIFPACKKDNEIEIEKAPFQSYILRNQRYYQLHDADLSFDKQDQQYTSTIWLTSGEENNSVQIDLLLLTGEALPEGEYTYKTLTSNNLELNRFHALSLQYGEKNSKEQVNSFENDIKNASIQVKQSGDLYTIDGEFEYDGSVTKVHYEGKVDFLEYW